MGAQQTIVEYADTATENDDTPMAERELLDRAQQHAVDVAAEHFSALPIDAIEWEVSHRAERQVGVTTYDPETDGITIALSWDAYDSQGWEQFSSTVTRSSFRGRIDRG